jgi:GcrA cell cycle regulator
LFCSVSRVAPASEWLTSITMPGSASWTPERDALMAECFGRKMSCSATAAVINERFNSSYSRNAVIGRALRKGIATAGVVNLSHKPACDPAAWRSSGVTKRAYQRRKAKEREMAAKPDPQNYRCVDVEPLNLDLLALESDMCRWPFGDGPFVFCGCPTLGGPYCEPHSALATRPAHERQSKVFIPLRSAA